MMPPSLHAISVLANSVTLLSVRRSRFTPEYECLLERLRSARSRARVTQADLANRLGVPQQYISRFENGETRMDVVQLWHYCRALGVRFSAMCRHLDSDFGRAD